MNILIIGYGYVGSAVGSVFNKHEQVIIDPKFTRTTIKDVAKTKFDLVFVCVDTPTGDKFCILDKVLNDLNSNMLRGTVVCCKSTAPPAFYKLALKKYCNIKLVYSPEYLSHHSNVKDFQNQKFLILGGEKNSCKRVNKILRQKIKTIKTVKYTDIETAALVKYSENAFLAYKITFFNELLSIHNKLKIKTPFSEVVNLLTLDSRIGTSHTQVPGRDGKYGWGGHCFEKDNLELQKFSKSKLIEFMRKINKIHRSR